MSWRKLLVLIRFLPPESAVNTAIRNAVPEDRLAANSGDPSKASWSAVETLLAVLVDEIRQLEWMYASAHTDKTVPRPTPLSRPGTKGRRKLRTISLDVAQRMDPRLRGLSAEEAQQRLQGFTGGSVN